jgi:iron complex transport system ATP-binding protein
MADFSGRLISELSDGERQRVMIARLLAQDTEIMIMDEPTAFLDIGSKYEVLHLLSNLAHNNNKNIIFSTHDMQMAISHADKIWLIIDDNLIEGAPEDHMIARTFDHLFDSSPGKFDPETGSLCFNNKEKGSIFLEGDGEFERHWIKKALQRAGFSISEKQTIPYITITGTGKCNYLVTEQHSVRQFVSIYTLIRFLSKEYSFTVE